jgi:hypothetical protein
MKTMSIAKDALKAVWNHKSLWLFGFFAAAAGGAGGGQTRAHGSGAAHELPAWLPPALAVAAVIALGVMFMMLTSQGALIDGARKAKNGEATGVGAGFRAGLASFWKVAGIVVSMGLLMLLSAAVLAAPMAAALLLGASMWIVAPLALPLVVIGVPWFLSVHFVTEYAMRIAVLDGRGVFDSIFDARVFLRGRVLESVKLLLVSALGRAGAAAAGLLVAVPGAAVGLGLYFATHSIPLAAVAGGLLAAPFIAAVLGASGTFGSMIWTLGFLESRDAAR